MITVKYSIAINLVSRQWMALCLPCRRGSGLAFFLNEEYDRYEEK
mgnify:CR=1 FL=1